MRSSSSPLATPWGADPTDSTRSTILAVKSFFNYVPAHLRFIRTCIL